MKIQGKVISILEGMSYVEKTHRFGLLTPSSNIRFPRSAVAASGRPPLA
jgi:hypothetical protein